MTHRGIMGLAAAGLAIPALIAAAQAPAPSSKPAATRPAKATTRPATQPVETKTMSADEVLSRMLKPAATADRPLAPVADPAVDQTSGRGAVAPNAPVVTVLREGSYVVDRIGRLSRAADGSHSELVFESDGRAMQDPPVILIPNQKLMLVEDTVANSDRDVRLRVTGMLTEYRGRNYLLLEKASVVSEASEQLYRRGI